MHSLGVALSLWWKIPLCLSFIKCSVRWLSHVWLFAIPWTAACQASLSITNSQSLLKLMSIESVIPSNHLILCCPLLLLSVPASGSFPVSRLFASVGQSTGVSALASVLPMNLQGWFPLGLTGLISLLSKRLSRVFAINLNVQFSSAQFSRSVVSNSLRPHKSQHARPPITNSRSSLRLASIESMMPSSHLILCHPLLFLPPIPPSIKVFSNESTLLMRWPKYWSFSFSIIPSKEIPGLKAIYIYSISFLLTKNWFTKQIWLD